MEQERFGTGLPTRQITPPDSPHCLRPILLPAITTVFTNRTQTQQTTKMSLDFIAPGSRSESPESCNRTLPRLEYLSAAAAIHRGSRPSSPLLPLVASLLSHTPNNSPSFYKPSLRSEDDHVLPTPHGLPSPAWSAYSEPYLVHGVDTLSLGPVGYPGDNFQRRSSQPPNSGSTRGGPYLTPPPGLYGYKVQKRRSTASSPPASRGERHTYDPEERYALVYLRREEAEKKFEWKDVISRYLALFPPNTPRRYKVKGGEAKNLPAMYPHREVQGLQCRLYRIRSEEGLPRCRETLANGAGVGFDAPEARKARDTELKALEAMAVRHKLSRAFLRKVELLASKDDVGSSF